VGPGRAGVRRRKKEEKNPRQRNATEIRPVTNKGCHFSKGGKEGGAGEGPLIGRHADAYLEGEASENILKGLHYSSTVRTWVCPSRLKREKLSKKGRGKVIR